jgi:hypothetical protein
MSRPEANDEAEQATPQQTDELSVLAGHARVFSANPSAASARSSSSPASNSSGGDVHPSLMEDLIVMQERIPGAHRTDGTSSSMGAELDGGHSTLRGGIMQPFVQAAHVDSFEAVGGMNTGDGSQPEYLNPTGGNFTASVAAMDDLGNVFAYEPSSQDWGTMRDDINDISWQGFVAGLGVSGGVYN